MSSLKSLSYCETVKSYAEVGEEAEEAEEEEGKDGIASGPRESPASVARLGEKEEEEEA